MIYNKRVPPTAERPRIAGHNPMSMVACRRVGHHSCSRCSITFGRRIAEFRVAGTNLLTQPADRFQARYSSTAASSMYFSSIAISPNSRSGSVA